MGSNGLLSADAATRPSASVFRIPVEGGFLADGWMFDFSNELSSAVLAGDRVRLEGLALAIMDADSRLIGDAGRDVLEGFAESVASFLFRMPAAPAPFAPDSEMGRVLSAVFAFPGISGREISARTGLDSSQVSRSGRRLQRAGFLSLTRLGRVNSWLVTPKGASLARQLGFSA